MVRFVEESQAGFYVGSPTHGDGRASFCRMAHSIHGLGRMPELGSFLFVFSLSSRCLSLEGRSPGEKVVAMVLILMLMQTVLSSIVGTIMGTREVKDW